MISKTFLHHLLLLLLLPAALQAQRTRQIYLSGTDKDHTRPWEFYCTDGMNSGHWTTIPVPSCWEQQGFGGYNYGHDKNPHHEQGRYRYRFQADPSWKDQRVMLRFEGVMTDAQVLLNGQSAGPRHQGAFYPFQYEVTHLLRYDGQENLLEVTVDKESANESVNQAERRADYWIFGGIFRPVSLLIQPQRFIQRVAIDARHDGRFSMQAYINQPQDCTDATVELTIRTLDGKQVGPVFRGSGIAPDGSVTLAGHIRQPLAWSAETPHLYQADFRLRQGRRTLHLYSQRFGFRTIEVRQADGIYVNNQKVRMRGVCRHTFWPESGRTSSPQLALQDIQLIKDMNMNAVRMSHYPPDAFFLDLCDSLGLYVLDELAGWQSRYDTPTAHLLIADMVQRDVNHPSILFWDNGNEGGFNTDVRQDYPIHDPQHRHVLEPWGKLNGINTKHYPSYGKALASLESEDYIYMPTESLHGLYDGGHGAGLYDYWQMMLTHPLAGGQFLWDFADEGVVRRDLHDSIDCRALLAPDGILGPHHEKEGSFYTIRQVWSPVQISQPDWQTGTAAVDNRYDFTNLAQCRFGWKLLRYPQPLTQPADSLAGTLAAPDVAPHASGRLNLHLPPDWQQYDVYCLTATDPTGRELFSWRWNITPTSELARRISRQAHPLGQQQADELITRLQPRIVGQPKPLDGQVTCQLLPTGIIQVSYTLTLDGDYDYAGVGFTCPQEGMQGATLMANGPYRVWKNRLQGPVFGVYDKSYNDAVTGQDWIYPEFKGYYANFHAVRINGGPSDGLTLCATQPGQYLQLLRPTPPVNYYKRTDPAFPQADLSVLLTIPGIGNKFANAEDEGPQGRPQHFDHQTLTGTLLLMK